MIKAYLTAVVGPDGKVLRSHARSHRGNDDKMITAYLTAVVGPDGKVLRSHARSRRGNLAFHHRQIPLQKKLFRREKGNIWHLLFFLSNFLHNDSLG
jgi:hypothetical protein